MMKFMIAEKSVTFKELEKNIYKCICELGQNFTKEFLEQYDQMLMKEGDKTRYRHKGLRKTTIKTVYGEVTYSRAVYEVIEEDGTKHFVYRNIRAGKYRSYFNKYGRAFGKRDHRTVLQSLCGVDKRNDRSGSLCPGK